MTNRVPVAELAAMSVAAPASGRCLGQSLCQWVPLPHFVHWPSAAHFVYRAWCASIRRWAERFIGADPVCGVAPVESTGLFEWLRGGRGFADGACGVLLPLNSAA